MVSASSAAAAYYFLFAGGHDKAEAAAPAAGPQIKPVVFLDMPDVLVNLSSTGGSERTQYLKVESHARIAQRGDVGADPAASCRA